MMSLWSLGLTERLCLALDGTGGLGLIPNPFLFSRVLNDGIDTSPPTKGEGNALDPPVHGTPTCGKGFCVSAALLDYIYKQVNILN